MSYLLLYGAGGWSQRWQIPAGQDDLIQSEISRVGTEGTSRISVIDSQTNVVATLVIAWQFVAAAVVVGSIDPAHPEASTGQYA